jgi:hypothetical protein
MARCFLLLFHRSIWNHQPYTQYPSTLWTAHGPGLHWAAHIKNPTCSSLSSVLYLYLHWCWNLAVIVVLIPTCPLVPGRLAMAALNPELCLHRCHYHRCYHLRRIVVQSQPLANRSQGSIFKNCIKNGWLSGSSDKITCFQFSFSGYFPDTL